MEENIKKWLLTVCRLLDKYQVKYMLIGGTAVALNGYYRHSLDIDGNLTEKPDIDIWYNPSYDNYFNILKVMESLGQDVSVFNNEQTPNPKQSFFKLDFDDFTLDFLPEIKAPIKFFDAYNRKETVDFEETEIHYMNYLDLIEDKLVTARSKDVEDIIQLKIARKKE